MCCSLEVCCSCCPLQWSLCQCTNIISSAEQLDALWCSVRAKASMLEERRVVSMSYKFCGWGVINLVPYGSYGKKKCLDANKINGGWPCQLSYLFTESSTLICVAFEFKDSLLTVKIHSCHDNSLFLGINSTTGEFQVIRVSAKCNLNLMDYPKKHAFMLVPDSSP